MKEISFRHDILPLKDMLYRLALRITMHTAEAEDIVQETFIRVWNRRDEWLEINSIEAFCLTICRNLALDATRKKGFHNVSTDEEHSEAHIRAAALPDCHTGPYKEVQIADQMSKVRDIINSLPEKQRSCIQLRDFEGKSYRDVAEALNITEEQVKVNIFRARQTIKQKFNKIDSYGL